MIAAFGVGQTADTVFKLEDEGGGFVSETLLLFDDETFVYANGGCTSRSFCIGTYEKKDGVFRLLPYQVMPTPKVYFEMCVEPCQKQLTIVQRNASGDTLDLRMDLFEEGVYQQNALAFDTVSSVDFTLEDPLRAKSQLKEEYIDFPYRKKYFKQNCMPLELVCFGLGGIYPQPPVWLIEENQCGITIDYPLPRELNFYVQMLGFVEYRVPKPKAFVRKGQAFEWMIATN